MPGKALLDPERALALVLEHAPTPRVEERAVEDAVGLVLAEPVLARHDEPPFTRALMDGYAVRLADAGRGVICAGESAAGRAGAERPADTEAVVRIEDVLVGGSALGLPATIVPGQHLQARGALCRQGQEVIGKGVRLTPLALASAITAGNATVQVLAPPRLAVITTGDELLPVGQPLGDAQIHDSNSPMLRALARRAGLESISVSHAGDELEAIAAAVREASAADVIVLTGGVSAGRYDLVPAALAELGAQLLLHRVAQQPGKPLLVAKLGRQLVFGLPGTPLGSHLGFCRYVTAALRRTMGLPAVAPSLRARLEAPLRASSDRVLFRLARAERRADGLVLVPLSWRGSSDLVGPALANGYLRLPPGEHDLPVGSEVSWEPSDPEAWT